MRRPPRCLIVLLVAAAMLLPGCGRSEPDESADGRRTLNLLMWSDYLDPQIVELFEENSGARVAVDTYDNSDEMQTRVQRRGGDRRYDLLVVADYKVPELASLNFLQPLDRARVPNADHVMPRFRKPPYDPEDRFSLPYQWGTVGILYRKDRVPAFEPTWALVFDPSHQPGPFLLLDDMRDGLGAALKYLGHSVNATDPAAIRAAGEVMLAAVGSANCRGFRGSPAACEEVRKGAAALAIVYSSDAFRAILREGGDALGYAIPAEGSEWWVDAMVLPADAEDGDLAYAFMNFLLDPQIGGQLAEFNQAGTPNQAARPYLSTDTRANPALNPSEGLVARLEPLHDVGDARAVYEEVWAVVKAP